MDAATIGAVIACAGVMSGSVVAWLGKRGETALSRFNSVTDQVQEERDRLQTQLTTAQGELITLHQQRQADLIEITRLQMKVIQLGGDP